MRADSFWKLVLLLPMITACSSQPSARDLAKELETIASWTATAQMVGEARLKGSVPTVYAKQTLQTTQKELDKESKTVAKVAPAQARTKVIEQFQQLQQSVVSLEKAVETDDRTTLTHSLARLSTQKQALERLMKTSGEQL
ncbi:hypothetical protein [Scytonema sp. NUACC26]|uniref:hypothetical protein n=1 Tax=Scytonema sp. NUACC26 TaxID=3140176 RepID=UPI0034DC3B1E